MYKLIQYLIAFKYACKINHWQTTDYAKHLQYDRLSEDIDTWTDKIAECYFMANDKQSIFNPDLLNPKIINKNLVEICESIIQHLEELQSDDSTNQGTASMLSTIEEEFLNKLAIAKLQ